MSGEAIVARMIRKQLYLSDRLEKKLQDLARDLNCSEAEVVRLALDRLPLPGVSIDDRLRRLGVLAPVPDGDDLPLESQLAEMEQANDEWLLTQVKPLRLSAAVLEDRR